MKTDYLDYFIGEVFDLAPFEQMFYFLFENDLLEQFYQYCDENCTDDGYDIWYDRIKELVTKNNGDAITLKRCEEICKRLKEKGFASVNVVYGVGSYCVSPETKILCADFKWRKAKDIEVGQKIINFNEDPIYGSEKRKSPSRKYTTGEITFKNPNSKKCVKIKCGDKTLTCSYDHPCLVLGSVQNRDDFFGEKPSRDEIKYKNMNRGNGLIWKKANQLIPGDKIAYFGEPWEDESESWLAGLYDGEGTLYTGKAGNRRFSLWRVSVSQNEGVVLDKIRKELSDRGFSFYENMKRTNCVSNVITGGLYEHLRFIGQIRPIRLLTKAMENLNELPSFKLNHTYFLKEINEIEDIGLSDIVELSVSNGTFITDGFLTHNTYQYNTRDTFGFALKSTLCKIDGQEKQIFKDPKTDNGIKKSQKGAVIVLDTDNGIIYTDGHSVSDHVTNNLLRTVFLNGELVNTTTLAKIRQKLLS